ncbi:MAG: hypothetical protein KGL39_11970 [Patescibacteria group bacterium]|nr:hypothetical protein [Patescibacteria group bacterium]
MRVIFPYTKEYPEAIEALKRCYPQAELCRLEGDTAYFELMASVWTAGEETALVEHDIVVRPGALEELSACPNPYCGYAYRIGEGFNAAWGCTKFSAELIRATQTIWRWIVDQAEAIPIKSRTEDPRHWFNLDSRFAWIAERAFGAGTHCIHYPAVVHLHPDYVPAGMTAFEDAEASPNPAPHHCWKGHVCRCAHHGDGHACPIRTSKGGTAGGWAHNLGSFA